MQNEKQLVPRYLAFIIKKIPYLDDKEKYYTVPNEGIMIKIFSVNTSTPNERSAYHITFFCRIGPRIADMPCEHFFLQHPPVLLQLSSISFYEMLTESFSEKYKKSESKKSLSARRANAWFQNFWNNLEVYTAQVQTKKRKMETKPEIIKFDDIISMKEKMKNFTKIENGNPKDEIDFLDQISEEINLFMKIFNERPLVDINFMPEHILLEQFYIFPLSGIPSVNIKRMEEIVSKNLYYETQPENFTLKILNNTMENLDASFYFFDKTCGAIIKFEFIGIELFSFNPGFYLKDCISGTEECKSFYRVSNIKQNLKEECNQNPQTGNFNVSLIASDRVALPNMYSHLLQNLPDSKKTEIINLVRDFASKRKSCDFLIKFWITEKTLRVRFLWSVLYSLFPCENFGIDPLIQISDWNTEKRIKYYVYKMSPNDSTREENFKKIFLSAYESYFESHNENNSIIKFGFYRNPFFFLKFIEFWLKFYGKDVKKISTYLLTYLYKNFVQLFFNSKEKYIISLEKNSEESEEIYLFDHKELLYNEKNLQITDQFVNIETFDSGSE